MPPAAPAFTVPEAWITATLTLTLEERGAYATLLAVAAVEGGVSADLTTLARLLRSSRRKTAQILANIWPKFSLSREGFWVPCPQGSVEIPRRQVAECGTLALSSSEFSTASTGRSHGRGYRTSTSTSTGTSGTGVPRSVSQTPVHPVEPVENRPASTWKRGLALAHAVIETCPDRADWTPEFKARAQQQRLPYDEPGPRDGRPLYARALDYAQFVRESRRNA